jgi:hypothetical protein
LHLNALTLVRRLCLLALCRLAISYAHWRCPPPLSAGSGGRPRRYAEASLLLIALLRVLWRLSYQDMHDWLVAWPALALACGLPLTDDGQPLVPSPSQQWKRAARAGAPVAEALLVVMVRRAVQWRVAEGRDLIVDSAPILAWRQADPDATVGHAPAHHPRPLPRGYRVHTLVCRGSGLPLLFLLSPADAHDAPVARPLRAWAMLLYGVRPRVIRLDAVGFSVMPGALAPFIATLLVSLCKSPDAPILSLVLSASDLPCPMLVLNTPPPVAWATY